MKRTLIAALALLLACLMLFAGCASHGQTLIWAGSEEISVNLFQLYLSRMKGSLHGAGHDVGNPDYWASYISTDNTTTADYYTKQVFDGLRHIAAAMIIYEELGLALPDTVIDGIDAEKVELNFDVKPAPEKPWATTGTKMSRFHNVTNSLSLIPEELERFNIERYERYKTIEEFRKALFAGMASPRGLRD